MLKGEAEARAKTEIKSISIPNHLFFFFFFLSHFSNIFVLFCCVVFLFNDSMALAFDSRHGTDSFDLLTKFNSALETSGTSKYDVGRSQTALLSSLTAAAVRLGAIVTRRGQMMMSWEKQGTFYHLK